MIVGMAVVGVEYKAAREDSGGLRGKARLLMGRDDEQWPSARKWSMFGSL